MVTPRFGRLCPSCTSGSEAYGRRHLTDKSPPDPLLDARVVGGLGLAWQPAFLVIIVLYFYAHYLFASGAAHIGAMYTAFLSVMVACGERPPRLVLPPQTPILSPRQTPISPPQTPI
eukprot:3541212-Pyramimonas_sp.AAC.1